METFFLALLIIGVIIAFKMVKTVPQQEAWIIERLGKFNRVLEPGLNFIIPFLDAVAYKHTLKERAIDVIEQTAITRDNVSLVIDGVIYIRVINPVDASYGIENLYFAATQLAQTSMRSAIGKIALDRTFEDREALNAQIVEAINEAATTWGIQCMRYEIRDIRPPENVIKAMEMQVAAERQKRAEILESEGKKQAKINIAEATKRETILNSEGIMTEQVNKATGEADAIKIVATATAQSIETIAGAINKNGGKDAVSLKIAEQYVEAFAKLAKDSNTLIIPANSNDASGMIANALTIFNSLSKDGKSN